LILTSTGHIKTPLSVELVKAMLKFLASFHFMGLKTAWLMILAITFLGGCGKIIPDIPEIMITSQRAEEAEKLLNSDPQGPIPKPSIPQADLIAAPTEPPIKAEKITYGLQIIAPDTPASLKEEFLKVNDLSTMADRPLNSPLTLTRRMHSAVEQGRDLLKSLGYFEGQAKGQIEQKGEGYEITIELMPGPLYRLDPGKVYVVLEDTPETVFPRDPNAPNAPNAPHTIAPEPLSCPVDPCPANTLTQAGLIPGAPAKADDVLASVDRLAEIWQNGGYPKAKVTSSHYSIDTSERTLLAEITLWPGPYATMGPVEQQNAAGDIKDKFLNAYLNWQPGQSWDQSLSDRYRENLMQTGLFKSVEIAPSLLGTANDPVLITLEAAPRRTVSGSINFDSDFGPGIDVSWEHRSFTGRGDRLRIVAPIWRDLMQLGASYQQPFFLSRRQKLLLDLSVLKEKTDSYRLNSISAASGLERLFTRKIKVVFGASLEKGSLEEELAPRREYMVAGFPVTFEWSDADSILDAHKGLRISLLLSPYFGHYRSDFEVLKYRLDANFYHPLMGPDTLILALRGVVGAISGTGPQGLPASLRFYGGGGKSVRGYEYQSIGPKNLRGRPIGGAATNEVGLELRYRWSETMGVTAFIDGGMVYNNLDVSKLGQDLLWGGGLGFRYYSPIGPFRLDLATPLTPRPGDDPIQIYLSLGQSF
jgi:translocation and assembly module TamA